MVTIQRILCPVDFSDFSRRGLSYAALLGKWYGADIEALHVHPVPLPMLSAVPTSGTVWSDPAAYAAQVREDLERFVQPAVAGGARVTPVVGEGEAVARILERAATWPADLIVTGTHGRSGFERLLLGSVTEKVLRKAPCPVLTVPRQLEASLPHQPPVFKQVLCPIDFSDASLSALEYALSLAQESGGQLTLLHVLEGFDEEHEVYAHFDVPEYRGYMARMARERLEKLVPSEVRVWCTPQLVVTEGKAYRRIVELAHEQTADVIVMGVLGRNPMDMTLFGSTTHHVVREASCPVLTIRRK